MNPILFDHIWQSTVVLAGIGLLTLFFRNNGAPVRHALWVAASLKFLLPFFLLNRLGNYLSALLAAPPVQPPAVQAIYAASQPFSDGPVFVALPAPGTYLLPALFVWGAGILAVAVIWLSRWWKLRATLRTARDSAIAAPMPVKLSATLMEPGLIGIFRAVLLLPEGIAEKLDPAELQSIIAHEVCHLRRRDNLTAALHMLVEAIFWFWPPVWWLGTRLVAERERACDEAVLAGGNDPQTYAQSILKVCKHYVSSPLACASGVSSADLKQRMEDIMKDTVIARLNLPKKALLAAFGAAALALPLAAGVFIAPSALAQAQGPLAPEIYIGGARMPPPPAGTSAIEKGGSGPSLGLAEALRLYSESLQRGAPDYGVMTPRLQKATRESFGILVSDAKRLGAVRTVTFRGVDARGLEVYDVGYEHGTASYNAAPLVNGKLDKLAWGDVLVPGELPHSGTALALNKYVQTLQDGKPDYDDMTPALAANARESYRLDRSEVEALGAQITTAYKGGGMMGLDVFEVTFERGSRQWVVAMENGKLSAISGPHVGFWD